MTPSEYIRNLTWVGSLLPPDVDAFAVSWNDALHHLNESVGPSRRNWGAPKGRRTRYFHRIVEREFSPRMAKVEVGEKKSRGSKIYFDDPFWQLLNTEPLEPRQLSQAWSRVSFLASYPLVLSPNAMPTISLEDEEFADLCHGYLESDCWSGFRGLFILLRVAHASKKWNQFAIAWAGLAQSALTCYEMPALTFSRTPICMFVLIWYLTNGRCGLEVIPRRLWFSQGLLWALFRLSFPDAVTLHRHNVPHVLPLPMILSMLSSTRNEQPEIDAEFCRMDKFVMKVLHRTGINQFD